jgi:phosphatidylglycerol:prolipoprotein diacylglycerol transferase
VILAALRISRGWKTAPGERIGVCPRLHVLDMTALIAPLGLMFGRLANFVNGELLGKIVAPPGVEGPWWSVQFPQELRGWVDRGVNTGHAPDLSPAQQGALDALVESAARPGDSYAGAIDRIAEHASRHAAQLKPLLASRHPSQLYQAAAEGLVLGAVLWLVFARPRQPGVIGSVFLLAYGALRIGTELWRLPDPQFLAHDAGRPMGLSRGQWLSAGMVAAGVAALVVCMRRNVPKLGGWLSSRGRSDEAAGRGVETGS